MKQSLFSQCLALLGFLFAAGAINDYFTGCASTAAGRQAQVNQLKSDAVASAPIVEAGITAAGGNYGALAANLYGMAVQAWAGQPAAQGSADPAIANAVAAKLPGKTGAIVAAVLTAAADMAQAKVQTTSP